MYYNIFNWRLYENKDAQEKVDAQIQNYGGYWRAESMFLRVIEEIGELSRAINIKYGDKKSKSIGDGREVEMELADVFYTSVAIANFYKVDLTQSIIKNLNIDSTDIEVIQKTVQLDPTTTKLSSVQKLITKVGVFAKQIEESIDIDKGITDIIINVISISNIFDIDLSKEFSFKMGIDEDKLTKVYGVKETK